MSQAPEVASPTQSSPNLSLHPVLQAALGSLDVDLEAELSLYRRQLADTQAMSPRREAPHQPDKTDRSFYSVPSPQDSAASGAGDLVYPRSAFPSVDNLASSEQLLRSLAESEAQSSNQRRFKNNLLTPLGVGAMLLLLLSGATMGYIVMNQIGRGYLESRQNRRSSTPAVAQPPTDTSTGAAPIPNGPNLAADEFVDLNLNNLSTLKISPSVSAATSPPAETKPAATPVTQSAIPSALESASIAKPVPDRETATPTRKQEDIYYVLTTYNGSSSLAQARKIAPDAYVLKLPEGNRIQIAAFLKEPDARAFANKIQKQGLSVWVYRP